MTAVRLARRAMGTAFEVLVCGENERWLRAAAEEALAEVDRLDDQLSLYRPTSELCHVNARAAAGPVKVEPRLFALLERARELHALTDGAFDIAVAPLMRRFGFRGAGTVHGMRFVTLRAGTVRFTRRGVALDLGGIGKGYAIDRAVALLRARGITEALVHGGTSTIYAMGEWNVGLVDPRDPERRLGSLALCNRALSASSSLGRVNEQGQGHIVDPRTGQPVDGTAAWAVGPSATDTDALATAFLIDGPREVAGAGGMRIEPDGELACAGVAPELHDEARRGVTRRAFMRGAAAAATVLSVGLHAKPAAAQEAAREVKLAVIGLGAQGRLLLGQLARLENVTIAAICDPDAQARKEGIALAGREVETYEDPEYLLDEETVDGVVIATPTHLHAPVALAALKAGAHVFCEAPLARTIADCRAVARAAAKSDRRFQVGHQRRCSALYPHVHEHIESGAIGDPLQIRAAWSRHQSWRRPGGKAANWRLYRKTSGGLLLEQGSHIFDLAAWYFDALPAAVSGFGGTLKWKDGRETHDTVQVVARYANGGQLGFDASLVSSFGGEQEIVIGDAATIYLRDQAKGLLFKEADTTMAGWEAYAKMEMLEGRRGIILDAEATKYKKHEEPEALGPDATKADFHAEMEQFVAAIRGGPRPRCNARHGLVAAVTALVAEEAVAKGAVAKFTKEHFEV